MLAPDPARTCARARARTHTYTIVVRRRVSCARRSTSIRPFARPPRTTSSGGRHGCAAPSSGRLVARGCHCGWNAHCSSGCLTARSCRRDKCVANVVSVLVHGPHVRFIQQAGDGVLSFLRQVDECAQRAARRKHGAQVIQRQQDKEHPRCPLHGTCTHITQAVPRATSVDARVRTCGGQHVAHMHTHVPQAASSKSTT